MVGPVSARESQNPVKVQKYIPIIGTWKIDDSKATFLKSDDDHFQVGVALTEVRTTAGRFRCKVEIADNADGCARIVFGFRSDTIPSYSIGIGGWHRAFTLAKSTLQRVSMMLYGSGKAENLKSGKPYDLEVNLRGSNVSLDVDGVRIFEETLPDPLMGDQVGVLGYGKSKVTFSDFEVTLDKPRAFVVMQFTEPYNSLWNEVIKPVAERMGFEAFRADDVFGPGVILQDIVRGISRSQAIIAEVTPRNPNVYYELGYAHAIGTPTILLAEQPE